MLFGNRRNLIDFSSWCRSVTIFIVECSVSTPHSFRSFQFNCLIMNEFSSRASQLLFALSTYIQIFSLLQNYLNFSRLFNFLIKCSLSSWLSIPQSICKFWLIFCLLESLSMATDVYWQLMIPYCIEIFMLNYWYQCQFLQ